MKKDLVQARSLIRECKEKQNTYLDLGKCGIKNLEDLPELFECTHLETLILSNSWWDIGGNNKIESNNNGVKNRISSIPKNILNLRHLRNLIIGGEIIDNWELPDLSGLGQLKELNTLYFSFNQNTDFSFLGNLPSLHSLFLSSSQITDISFLGNLPSLQILDISGNQISDISILGNLTELQSLDLGYNQITDFSFLGNLPSLHSLFLSSNQIADISFLGNLPSLQSLDLRSNQITDISILGNLPSLQSLDLSVNKITDISILGNLTALQILDLSVNQITDTSILSNLTALQSLDLRDNQIAEISILGNLIALQILDLSVNKITDISFLGNLPSLQSLDLRNNQITDIKFIKSLKNLYWFDLSDNQITEIPKSIANFSMDIIFLESYLFKGINLFNNPIISPHIDTVKEGKEAIIRFWERLEKEDVAYLYEAKLTLVGEGGAGKTSLSNRLVNQKSDLPKEDERTRGIVLNNWEFDNKNKEYVAHIWDFGGQDMYYPVHRFFLTEGSVFVLLASTRNEEHKFDYWIPTILQFGKDSPIVIVQNCFDSIEKNWNDISTYIGKTEFNIVKTKETPYYRIDLPKNNRGLSEVKEVITNQLRGLPHFGKKVTKTWLKLRERILELKSKNLISYQRFEKEYKKIDVNNLYSIEDIKDSAKFFHNLGLILWYHDDKNLNDTVIINPKWALDAVYKIIDDKEIIYGRITKKDFNRIWSGDSVRNCHRVLKHMLESFKIAFPLKHTPNTYIIPVLQESIPSKEIWQDNENCLRLVYRFDFMPKGLVNQLSAELSKYTRDEEIWNNAVNFYYNDSFNTKCQVFENFRDREITIKVYGTHPIKIIENVKHALNDIIEGYRGVKPEIFIPCICSDCKNKASAKSFSHSELMDKLHKKGFLAKMVCNTSDESMLIVDLLYKTGFSEIIEEINKDKQSSLRKELGGIHENLRELRNEHGAIIENQDKIIDKLDDHFEYLINISKNSISKEEIIGAIGEMNNEQTEDISKSLIIYLDEALKHYKGENLSEYKNILGDIKKGKSNFEVKLKLAIPLINLIGINIETEFDLKNWVKEKYKEHELKIFKFMGFV